MGDSAAPRETLDASARTIAALNSERAYQRTLAARFGGQDANTLRHSLSSIIGYIQAGVTMNIRPGNKEEVLAVVRKIGAVVLECLDAHPDVPLCEMPPPP